MKIGGEYRLRNLGPYHWHNLAAELPLNPDAMIHRVRDFAAEKRLEVAA